MDTFTAVPFSTTEPVIEGACVLLGAAPIGPTVLLSAVGPGVSSELLPVTAT